MSRPPAHPSEFQYWQNIEKVGIRRIRKILRFAAGVDPDPGDEKVRDFAESYYDADPLAEAFVHEVVEARGYSASRQLLDQALAEGVASIEAAPPSLIALFADLETDPEWVDWRAVELGAKVFRRYGSTVFLFAGAITLSAYTENSVAKALILAGGYEGDSTRRRFLETASFWIDVSEPLALKPGNLGRAAALRVRIMHVFVRRRLAEHPEWNAPAWGVPISQGDAVLTLMGGSVAPGLGMQALGYRPRQSEILAMMHFWRYVGHLMGVRPRWYPESIREALQLLFVSSVKGARKAGDDGARLCQSYGEAFRPQEGLTLVKRLRAHIIFGKHRGYTRFFTPLWSPTHLPSSGGWVLYPLACFPWIFAAETLRRRSVKLEGVADRRARRQRRRWLDRELAEHRASFRPPESMAR